MQWAQSNKHLVDKHKLDVSVLVLNYKLIFQLQLVSLVDPQKALKMTFGPSGQKNISGQLH